MQQAINICQQAASGSSKTTADCNAAIATAKLACVGEDTTCYPQFIESIDIICDPVDGCVSDADVSCTTGSDSKCSQCQPGYTNDNGACVGGGLSGGAIAGIGIGAIVGAILVVIVIAGAFYSLTQSHSVDSDYVAL